VISTKDNSYSFLLLIPFDSKCPPITHSKKKSPRWFIGGDFSLGSSRIQAAPAKSRGLAGETSFWKFWVEDWRIEKDHSEM